MLSFANILRDMSNTSKFRQSHLCGPSAKHAMKHCACAFRSTYRHRQRYRMSAQHSHKSLSQL